MEINGEKCPYHLDDFVNRGRLYAGVLHGTLSVHWDSPHGYPIGDSLLHGLPVEQIPELIAVLRAAQDRYSKKPA